MAAVAAETPYQAWDAVRAIAVDYEVLPFVADEEDALKPDAPRGAHERATGRATPTRYERGDVEAGLRRGRRRRRADLHDGVRDPRADRDARVASRSGMAPRLTVWDSTQGVYAVQSGLAQALKLPVVAACASSATTWAAGSARS